MRLLAWPAGALALLFGASLSSAQTGSLEDRVKALEMKMSEKDSSDAAEAGSTSTGGDSVDVYFDKGLKFKGGKFSGMLGAYAIVHFTGHTLLTDAQGGVDTFRIRDARIYVGARFYEAFEVYVNARFLSGSANLQYGWVEFNKWDAFKLRVGQFKEPFSPETMESIRYIDLPERSYVSLLAPGVDIGAMIHGEVGGGLLTYYLGLFNGNGAQNAGDENSEKDAMARVMLRPGAKSDSDAIKHLYIGGGATYGNEDRATGVTPFSFQTPMTGRTIHQQGSLAFDLDDTVYRLGADLMWCWGPLEIKGEYAYYNADVEIASDNDVEFRAHAWYGTVGVWIGGSRAPMKRPEVKKPLFDGGMGAFHIVGRVSQLKMLDTFEQYLGFTGTRNATEWAICVNYWPNAHTRFSVCFADYEYDHETTRLVGLPNGDTTNDETVIVVRAQVDF
jgi:phosphate-selective porin OprO/OprP